MSENETLKDKAAIYLEEIGISGDTMVQCDISEDKGWLNLFDIMVGFLSEQPLPQENPFNETTNPNI